MELKGSVVAFKTRAPTIQEINDLPKVFMTLEAKWDPQDINLSVLGDGNFHNKDNGKVIG